jgi:Tol biopolymer transport system component
MKNQRNTKTDGTFAGTNRIVMALLLGFLSMNQTLLLPRVCAAEQKKVPSPKSAIKLEKIPYKIVYETFRKTDDKENWELYLINADGSNPINLTRSSDIDEMYPHVSPDGGKICFVADEIVSGEKVRNIYYMNIDGTGRVKVADNARQGCWSPDGKTIAYLKGEFERYTTKDFATKGIFFYDIETQKHREHPNKGLHHLYNICYSPDGNWFLATVHGGMDYEHAILAIEANGNSVFDLTKFKVTGCRPDCKFDGRQITWGATDWDLCVGNVDLSSSEPKVTDVHTIVSCEKECEVYHVDFSPDGKYIAFSYGPESNEQVGEHAPGWNICVTDLTGKWVQVTTDGNQNKEPDWVPLRTTNR